MTPNNTPSTSAASLSRPLFLWSLPFMFLYFGLPIISKDFGASALGIGGLFSAFTVTTLLMRPVVGWAIDHYGRKTFFVIALLIYAAAMGLFAFAESLTWLYAARIVQGIGSAFLWTTMYTIVSDLTSPEGRGKALGQITQITTRGGLIGILVAIALMSFISEGAAWKVVFIGCGLATLIGAWIAWREVPSTKPAARVAPAKGISSQLIKLMVVVFLISVPEAMLAPIYLIYLQDKFSTDVMTLGWAFFPAGLAAAFLSTRLGALSDRYGRVPMMTLGLAGSGIVSLLMPGLTSLIWLAVLYTLTSIMWGISDPARTAMVSDLTGDERRGAAYGVYDSMQSLGMAIGPVLGGMMYDTLGKGTPFYLDGIVLIVGALWVILVMRRGMAVKAESASAEG